MITQSTLDQTDMEKAQSLYNSLKYKVETPNNIGKLIVMDLISGDYEIDDMGIETSILLQKRHPISDLVAFRVGYKTAVSFCGALEPN